MIASIIIPSFQHAEHLPAAIESALAQTVRCEVIVVDDGSTDGTADLAARYASRVLWIQIPHSGVATARNFGLAAADGEFVMFLDADDAISPRKVAAQLSAFARHRVGWVTCDVRILDEGSGEDTTAAKRYGYAEAEPSGWLGPALEPRNFIPVMSPLIRREALGSIRFPAGKLEDWAFLRSLAALAPCAYVPEVLATYNRRRRGRHIDAR